MSHTPMSLAEKYAPDNPMPLGAYGFLMGAYGTCVAGLLWGASRRTTSEELSLIDTIAFGAATHKLARIIAKDWVTIPVRAPFVRYVKTRGAGEVDDESRGEGLQRAVGDLISCPFCMAPWVAAGLLGVSMAQPKAGKLLIKLFGIVAVSDFLQRSYSWLGSRSNPG